MLFRRYLRRFPIVPFIGPGAARTRRPDLAPAHLAELKRGLGRTLRVKGRPRTGNGAGKEDGEDCERKWSAHGERNYHQRPRCPWPE